MATDLVRSADFVWRHARLLDRRRFELFGAEGPDEADARAASVVQAVAAYQGPDGGFGSGIEPDLRSPHSQTQGVEVAIRLLAECGRLSTDEVRPMVDRALDWLGSVSIDGGVPFVLPSAMEHPRAPWWNTEPDPPPALNPTAPIAGLAAAARIDHPWVGSAVDFAWAAVIAADGFAFYDLRAAVTFLATVPDSGRAEPHLERIVIGALDRGDLALDPMAEGHHLGPLDLVDGPEHPAARFMPAGAIDDHLDALEAAQLDDGGWTVGWDPPSTTALAEWRGVATVNALRTLRSFGRI